MLTVGTDESYFKKVIDIVEQYPAVYGAIGLHPHNSKEYDSRLKQVIGSYLKNKKIVAYGEIGLDFFKNYSPRESQINAFVAQIELAQEAALPIIIHSRSAKEDTLRILRDTFNGNRGGVIHCYSYDLAAAKEFLDMGFMISIPGTITYKNVHDSIDVVKYVPMDRILAETDAPFLTPNPHRGKRNEPSFVKLTIAKIAQIKEKGIEETAMHLKQNFEKLFLRKAGTEDAQESEGGKT